MSSTNSGPSVTTTPNYVSQSAPAGSAAVPFDPSSVAITGGTINASGLVLPANVYLNSNDTNGASRLAVRKAIANVLAGGRSRLLVYGDSTTVGAGAGTSTGNLAGARALSYCSRLAAYLTSMGIAASNDSFMGDQNASGTIAYSTYDPRLTATGGFAPSGFNVPGGKVWLSSTSGANLAFTPTMTFDRFDVFTINPSGGGSFTVNVDGGATIQTIATAGSNTVAKTTVSCTRGTHTINCTTTSTSNTFIIGIVPWDSTLGGVDIIQAGWYGAVMGDFANAGSAWNPSNASMLAALAPDLSLVQLTVNDAGGATAPATYAANLAIVDSALAAASGAVMLMSGIPSGNANGTNGTLTSILAQLSARAVAQSRPYIDMNGRHGSYVSLNSIGWMADLQHGNAKLYADEAAWLAQTVVALAR